MATFDATGERFGGYAVNRAVFRRLLPDARLWVYAAGLVDPGDSYLAEISLIYEKDDTSMVFLGTVTHGGAGLVKLAMGPFDVFGTAGVPPGEHIPMVRLYARKPYGVAGTLACWDIWLRFFTQRA